MRSLKRQQQDIYFSKFREEQEGIDTVQIWEKPIHIKATVSVTSGTPEEIAAGIVPDYDRYLTYYRKKYGKNPELEEGMSMWVDVSPALDEDGFLALQEDGISLIVPPDYTLKRIIGTKKSTIIRYGIKLITGSE